MTFLFACVLWHVAEIAHLLYTASLVLGIQIRASYPDTEFQHPDPTLVTDIRLKKSNINHPPEK
jgi:hypothetical protein